MAARGTQFVRTSVHASPGVTAAGLVMSVGGVVVVVVERDGTHTPQDSGQVLFM